MSADDAIKIAREYAARHGRDVERYEPVATRVEDEWHVLFRGKDLLPGSFFSVYVNDATGTVRDLFPGK
jgi:hypothetical protein